ncbi:VOC family protein [Streptomyces radicis]|uniref:Oxidoreductase n=1 Tax=Streptomyces radicis TaxID=1750517 RepID=A0A3A9W2N0_9ACTN|nr:VOC family protein [Streptomyces radicis]RKN03464.1 oxidoreductase [Streptomyces radicis]RKN13326.1 oxidoreductase [Streptomyces radicis]
MGDTRVAVTGLDHIALAVPDLETALGFYTDAWGLVPVAEQGGRHHLAGQQSRHTDLVLSQGPTAALDHIALAVASPEVLERLAKRLVNAGHRTMKVSAMELRPGQTAAVVTHDPDGHRIELAVGAQDEGARDTSVQMAPLRLGHVVLGTPDQTAMTAFYHLLGFRVSDRNATGMWFLRCNADHHSLALIPADQPWLQHMAYDVGTVNEVMRGLALLREHDVTPVWGPGRHGPGSNVFTYYRDPAGFFIEYYGDLDKFDDFDPNDDITVVEWGPEHRGDVWGIAGRPPAAFVAGPNAGSLS